MCAIFEFWWNNFFMGMKFNFKFELWENFYKEFPCKNDFPWEFVVKWTQIKFLRNSFIKLLLKVWFNFYTRILCKIVPNFQTWNWILFTYESCFTKNRKLRTIKYIVNFMCAKFQQNQRTFFFTWKSFVKFSQLSNLKSDFIPIKKLFHQNSKIAHI